MLINKAIELIAADRKYLKYLYVVALSLVVLNENSLMKKHRE